MPAVGGPDSADENADDHLSAVDAEALVMSSGRSASISAEDRLLIPADTVTASGSSGSRVAGSTTGVLSTTSATPGRSTTAKADEAPAARGWRWREAGVYAAFLLIAFWITNQYWIGGHVSAVDVSDQAFFEYMLAHGAQAITHFTNPFYTVQLNVPVGVNLMVNTSILALAIPLAPITLLFGPQVSFALLMTLGLAGTAGAWYFLLSRQVVTSRSAAVVGGLIAGFGPGMISHANGHPNIIAQFLVPFIAWRTLKLREAGRSIRNGLILGLLVIIQVFINEEVLFIVALGLAVFVGAIALSRRSTLRAEIRPFLTGLSVAIGVAAVVLAYPLWWQFFGPNTYRGLSVGVKAFSTDLAAFPAFATRSVFGSFTNNPKLAQSAAEQNTFLGWPLLLACGVAIYWLRRHVVARALAITGFVLGVLSLGPTIKLNGRSTGIPGPWRLLNDLPVFNSAVPTRFSLLVLPIVAVLVALAHDKALSLDAPAHPLASSTAGTRARARQARFAWCLLLVLALVAVIPTPVPTQKVAPTPAFFSTGEWKNYVPAGETVLPVPLPAPSVVDAMFWAARSDLSFSMPRGYFLGPDPDHGNVAFFGAPARPTASLIENVILQNMSVIVHRSDRKAAIVDLRYWRVAAIVLVPGTPADKPLRETISDLIGIKPKFIDGVWVWNVKRLVAGHSSADLG